MSVLGQLLERVVAASTPILVFCLVVLIFGGFAYLPVADWQPVRAYELHYDVALAISDPFNTSWPAWLQVFGAIDGLTILLAFATFGSVVVGRVQQRIQLWEDFDSATFSVILEGLEAMHPDVPRRELLKIAIERAKNLHAHKPSFWRRLEEKTSPAAEPPT